MGEPLDSLEEGEWKGDSSLLLLDGQRGASPRPRSSVPGGTAGPLAVVESCCTPSSTHALRKEGFHRNTNKKENELKVVLL